MNDNKYKFYCRQFNLWLVGLKETKILFTSDIMQAPYFGYADCMKMFEYLQFDVHSKVDFEMVDFSFLDDNVRTPIGKVYI